VVVVNTVERHIGMMLFDILHPTLELWEY